MADDVARGGIGSLRAPCGLQVLHFFNVETNVRKQHLSLGKWVVSGATRASRARPRSKAQAP
eukprot:2440335-Prymnesium_polylepis.1